MKIKKLLTIGLSLSIFIASCPISANALDKIESIKGADKCSDRIKTSYNVAKEINSINKVNKVILTNAFKGEPDAMSVAPVAVRDK
ncbi:cell wall-binding repeat-containing protein, partial [Clostridioides difficile]|nr:cell wall-binding repeat-containing protein [Clostridioides difficile]